MAELEIAKHGKKAVDAVASKQHTLKDKIKDFLLEIFIIVFAVSLSIWFHGLSEKSHERHEKKEFLKGLKADLKHDIENVSKDLDFIKQQQKAYLYISNLKTGEIADKDTISSYQKYLYKYIGVQSNSGRYEGFKSSGKLALLENEELEDSVLDLYEEINPTLEKSLESYNTHKRSIADYVISNSENYPDGDYIKVLSSNPVKMRCKMFLSDTQDVVLAYQERIKKMHEILHLIEKDH